MFRDDGKENGNCYVVYLGQKNGSHYSGFRALGFGGFWLLGPRL